MTIMWQYYEKLWFSPKSGVQCGVSPVIGVFNVSMCIINVADILNILSNEMCVSKH